MKKFSLSSGGYSAINIFYPIDVNELTFGNWKFRLEKVTPEKLRLTYFRQID